MTCIIAIVATFAVFVTALLRMRRHVIEHSSAGLNRTVSVLHLLMILMFAIGRLASQGTEIYLWSNFIHN